MATLVQFDFPMQGPWGAEMAAAYDGLARLIADAPGLHWKIWTENEREGTGHPGAGLRRQRAADRDHARTHWLTERRYDLVRSPQGRP
jgi:hypothetical protein